MELWRQITYPLYESTPAPRKNFLGGSVEILSLGEVSLVYSTFSQHRGVRLVNKNNLPRFENLWIHMPLGHNVYVNERGKKIKVCDREIYISDTTQCMEAYSGNGATLSVVLDRNILEKECGRTGLHGMHLKNNNPLVILLTSIMTEYHKLSPVLNERDAFISGNFLLDMIVCAIGGACNFDYSPPATFIKDQIKLYILENIHNPSLRVEHFLDKFQLSRSALYRMFEKESGIARYIKQQRLELALKQILTDGNGQKTSIKAIAYKYGFPSPESFTYAFRVQFGCSPRDVMNKRFDIIHTLDTAGSIMGYYSDLKLLLPKC